MPKWSFLRGEMSRGNMSRGKVRLPGWIYRHVDRRMDKYIRAYWTNSLRELGLFAVAAWKQAWTWLYEFLQLKREFQAAAFLSNCCRHGPKFSARLGSVDRFFQCRRSVDQSLVVLGTACHWSAIETRKVNTAPPGRKAKDRHLNADVRKV